jgi:hypothetical protein
MAVMTIPIIDFDKRVTLVGGVANVTYIQDGNGYDSRANYVGRVDDQGALLAAEPVAATKTDTVEVKPKSKPNRKSRSKKVDKSNG